MDIIKESFDNLPIAVCFFDSRGIVRLVNRRMLHVGDMLLGGGFQTLSEITAALEKPPENVVRLSGAPNIYSFPDETALRFACEEVVTSGGRRYTQMTAADVTELVERQNELRADNEFLAESNRRARQLFEKIPDIVREEETLDMKMRVHDDIGHSILSARKALLGGAELDEIREKAAAWEKSIALLARANNMPEPPDALIYAKNRADELGVELVTEGDFPESERLRGLFALALRECITNCVRHAGGNAVYAVCEMNGAFCTVTITNNGSVPRGEIAEGGGLSALRRQIEKNGGKMTVRSTPHFELAVTLPLKG